MLQRCFLQLPTSSIGGAGVVAGAGITRPDSAAPGPARLDYLTSGPRPCSPRNSIDSHNHMCRVPIARPLHQL